MRMPDTSKNIGEFLREGNKLTDRDFMKALETAHITLKKRENDPTQFTVGQLLMLADLIGRPIEDVMAVVLAQIARNPEEAKKREEAKKQVVGRKYQVRKPKEEPKSEA